MHGKTVRGRPMHVRLLGSLTRQEHFSAGFRQQQAATSMWATEGVIRMHSVRHAFLASSNHWIRKTWHLVQCRASLILCATEVSSITSSTFSCRSSHNRDSMTHTNGSSQRTYHSLHTGKKGAFTVSFMCVCCRARCPRIIAAGTRIGANREINCKWSGNIQDVARARGLACIVTVQ